MTLLARLEAAEAGSVKLDAELWDLIDARPREDIGFGPIHKRDPEDAVAFDRPPPFTTSIDAALALVERVLPGAWFTFGKGRTRPDEPLYGAILFADDMRPDGLHPQLGEGEHEHSLVLAVLIALLKAKGPDHA